MPLLLQKKRSPVSSNLVADYHFDEYYTGGGQVLYDHSGFRNHGILGSTISVDTNDPTWTGQGASFTTDDYINIGSIVDAGGAVQSFYGLTIVFYTGTAINKDTATIHFLNISPSPDTTTQGRVILGASSSAVTNEIVNLGDKFGGNTIVNAWCDASASIAIGWHVLTFRWNGVYYDIILDGVTKPVTLDGTPRIMSLSQIIIATTRWNNAFAGYFTGSIANLIIYSTAPTDAMLARDYQSLKRYLYRSYGVSLP